MGAGKCGSCAGKDHVLTRGDLSGFAPTDGGSAPCSNAGGEWAEVSRRHSSGFILMKRRPEAKGENFPRCSILSLGRSAHIRCDRRDGGSEILMVDQNGSPLVGLSDYGPTPLVTARCGPACRVVWEGGDRNPFLSLLSDVYANHTYTPTQTAIGNMNSKADTPKQPLPWLDTETYCF